jgi:hypothetical protein
MSTGGGRISLLVDSPLRTLAHAMRGLDAEVKKQIGTYTKRDALPIWKDTLKANADSRLEIRVLVDSARVGATAQNVFLRAGAVGTLSSGTPVSVLVKATEYGASASRKVSVRSSKGKTFGRRMGSRFKSPRRGGTVAGPAARESIPRMADLWVQTAIRTIHDTIEKVVS